MEKSQPEPKPSPQTPRRGRVWKRIGLSFLGILLVAGAGLTLLAARFEPVIRPNVRIGLVDVGGLTKEFAAKKIRLWWETERKKTFAFSSNQLQTQPAHRSLTGYGIAVDDLASVDQVSTEDFWDSLRRQVGIDEAPKKELPIIYKYDDKPLKGLKEFVEENDPAVRPAKVLYRGGRMIKTYESGSVTLDTTKIHEVIFASLKEGKAEAELPIIDGGKNVPDDQIDRIRDVESSFTTRFPTSKATRCANIKLASSIIDGVVLMPGETWTFNSYVGRRTTKAGFKVAGVYKNGKHDVDIGGGICQVSTTLYNASLYADLDIVQRSNHSMPVAYVPLGRDATVDYGSHDLAIRNNKDHAIAISVTYEPGKLTFRILGQKDPDLKVEVTTVGRKTWSRGEKVVIDRSLPPGKSKIVDKGGSAGSVRTYRIVYRGGVEVRRDDLGMSIYNGAPKIIARNPSAPKTTGAADIPTAPDEPPLDGG